MSNKLRGLPEIGGWRRLVSVGHNNYVNTDQVVAIMESGPLPMRRMREKAGTENRLVDATAGRKTRSLIVTQSNHLILSALAPQTLQERLQQPQTWMDPAEVELEEGEFVS